MEPVREHPVARSRLAVGVHLHPRPGREGKTDAPDHRALPHPEPDPGLQACVASGKEALSYTGSFACRRNIGAQGAGGTYGILEPAMELFSRRR